jgi:hypothetical protein
MTAPVSAAADLTKDGEDALSAEPAFTSWPANDWVAEAASSPAEFELYFDEGTGLYEIRRIAGGAGSEAESSAPEAAVAAPAAEPVVEITVENDAQNDAHGEPLAGWASLAGPTGPSAFHTPLLWGLSLTGAADFSPLPALDQSRGGSAWRLEAAA